MSSPWLAWPAGCDPGGLSHALTQARERYVCGGAAGGAVRAGGVIRAVVAESWRRSSASGVDPLACLPPVELSDDELREARSDHQLRHIMPVVRRLLVDAAADAGLVVAVSDARGRLLWVEGEHKLRSNAESMHFVPGANWDEGHAGTNAPGTALAVDHPVQIFAAEHFSQQVTPWSCSAAPVHDPATNEILGVIDVTGGDQVAAPHTLALVRATVAAVEGELRLLALTGPPTDTPQATHRPPLRFSVLGGAGVLRTGRRAVPLSLRHSELVLLLSEHPAGRTAEQLAVGLYRGEAATVTVRAEMSRLRALVPELELRSRPYRLGRPVTTDLAEVRGLLARGARRRALDLVRGPVLPGSDAPEVVGLGAELSGEMRAALLDHPDPDLLLRFAETGYGRDDVRVWNACLAALPAGSPRRARVRARIAALDVELGAPGNLRATVSQPSRR